MVLTRGHILRIRLAGSTDEWCPAMVMLASPDGKSVLILLGGESVLRSSAGGAYFGGTVALVVDYTLGKVTDLLTRSEYDVQVATEVSDAFADLESPPN